MLVASAIGERLMDATSSAAEGVLDIMVRGRGYAL